jgi:kynureninase
LAARAGYRILREIGVTAIREKSLAFTQKLIQAADERGWPIVTPRQPEARGGTLVVQVDRAPEVCEELARRNVVVDFRPGVGIRFGPHFYNSEGDMERAIAETGDILSGS